MRYILIAFLFSLTTTIFGGEKFPVDNYSLEWKITEKITISNRNNKMALVFKSNDLGKIALPANLAVEIYYYASKMVEAINGKKITKTSSNPRTLIYGVQYTPKISENDSFTIELNGPLFTPFQDKKHYSCTLDEDFIRELVGITKLEKRISFWQNITEPIKQVAFTKKKIKICRECNKEIGIDDEFCPKCDGDSLTIAHKTITEMPVPDYIEN